MLTTVTLDCDVERMLREYMRRTRKSAKKALNDVIREALAERRRQKVRKFVVDPSPMGLLAGIDPSGLNNLADDLEVEARLEQQGRLSR